MPQPKKQAEQQVTPKQPGNPEQVNYDIFISQGIELASAAAQQMQGKASVDTIGNALYEIIKKVETEGEKNGVSFSLGVVLHGSNELLGHLIEMSGVQINEEQIKGAVGVAVGRYIQEALDSGAVTKPQLMQLAEQAQANMPQEQPGQNIAGVQNERV